MKRLKRLAISIAISLGIIYVPYLVSGMIDGWKHSHGIIEQLEYWFMGLLVVMGVGCLMFALTFVLHQVIDWIWNG